MPTVARTVCLFLAIAAASCSPTSQSPTNTLPSTPSILAEDKSDEPTVEPEGEVPAGFEEISAQARDHGVNLTVHRAAAGELDESGWCIATSTKGGFSVSLPNVFNDFMMAAKAEDGFEIQTFIVGTRDQRQIKFTAMGLCRADGQFKGDPLEDFAKPFQKAGELKSKRLIALGEMKGIEARVANRSSSAVFRLYKSPTTLYQLIVEVPSSIKPGEVEGDVERFLDSFTVAEAVQQ